LPPGWEQCDMPSPIPSLTALEVPESNGLGSTYDRFRCLFLAGGESFFAGLRRVKFSSPSFPLTRILALHLRFSGSDSLLLFLFSSRDDHRVSDFPREVGARWFPVLLRPQARSFNSFALTGAPPPGYDLNHLRFFPLRKSPCGDPRNFRHWQSTVRVAPRRCGVVSSLSTALSVLASADSATPPLSSSQHFPTGLLGR